MGFEDDIRALVRAVSTRKAHCRNEEAAKHSLVIPFLQAMGYDVYDPQQVVPEFTADIANKKGEKVDYAIMIDGEPKILIECKAVDSPLSADHAAQLARYFGVTTAKFGVLTDGVRYQFFTDLDDTNRMDKKAFLEVNLLEITDAQIEEIKRFARTDFNEDEAAIAAGELKYTKELKRHFGEELNAPSVDFIKFFARYVYKGVITQNRQDDFKKLVPRALKQYINDQLSERLKMAESMAQQAEKLDNEKSQHKGEELEPTALEMQGFHIVQAILSQVTNPARVGEKPKKNQGYAVVQLDGHAWRTACRLYFNYPKQLYLGIMDEKKEFRKYPLDGVIDIYKHAAALRAIVARIDTGGDQGAEANTEGGAEGKE